jgi:preprotein translocase subunit SecG
MTMILTVLLTLVLVLDCLLLILLVLIQLPKKEAGAGLAFGGAATDALFGAGTGNVLTKVTKYATAVFFGIAILLIMLQPGKTSTDLEKQMQKQASQPLPAAAQAAPEAVAPATPAVTPSGSNTGIPLPPSGTNVNIALPPPSDATPPKK